MGLRRLNFFLAIVCCFRGCLLVSGQTLPDISPQSLENKVNELMTSSLHHGSMQVHYHSLSFTKQPINGELLLNELSESIRNKFAERVEIVKNLRDSIEADFDTQSYKECCRLQDSEVEFDNRFRQKVLLNSLCLQVSSNSPVNYTVLQQSFNEACIANLERVPLLKWQYFGSEEGVTSQFPGLPSISDECGEFDNRVRPWYVQANAETPKQFVIAIDTSRNPGTRGSFDLAKSVAAILIDSANPRDQFVVVGFNDREMAATNTDDCFATSFIQAIPSNKRKLKNEVLEDLTLNGASNYTQGLIRAFSYFQRQNDVDQVIVFIATGAPADDPTKIFQTINRENERLGYSVYLMTFGIGQSEPGDFSILRRIAIQDGTSYAVPRPMTFKTGLFENIANENNLRSQITTYFDHFSVATNVEEPVWTVPYLDAWGLGVVISGALPVYSGSHEVLGVAAVDVTLDELLAESTYFGPSRFSYSFIIDKFGLIINHPLFPYVSDTQPLFVEATAYERDSEFSEVLKLMRNETSGKRTFSSTRVIPNGDGKRYSVDTKKILSTYYWKPIPGTPFIVCVVIPVDEEQTINPSSASNLPSSFLYHRFDIKSPPDACLYADTFLSSSSRSSVLLSGRSHLTPEKYLLQVEDDDSVNALESYMTGEGTKPQNLRNEIRDVVALTHKAEVLWATSEEDGRRNQALYRYIATREGVFRIFPARQLPRDLDPVTRPWYINAVANLGLNTLTPPYRNVGSGTSVITISRTLHADLTNGNTADVLGVMGMDFTADFFQSMMLEIYPECSQQNRFRCLLVDKAGYLIWSHTPVQGSSENVHLSYPGVEPEIMNALIRENLVVTQTCAQVIDTSLFRSFEIVASSRYDGATNGGTDGYCFKFSLLPVPETNTFFIVREADATNPGNCTSQTKNCQCPNLARETCTVETITATACECPCSINNNPDYNLCTNRYIINNESSYPCTAEASIPLQPLPTVSLGNLPSCSADNVNGTPTPSGNTSLTSGSIAGIATAGATLLLLLLVVVICYKRRLRIERGESSSTLSGPPRNGVQNGTFTAPRLQSAHAQYERPPIVAEQTYEVVEDLETRPPASDNHANIIN